MGRPNRGAPVLSGSIIARRPGLSTGGRADRQAGRTFSAVGRWSGFGPAQVQTCDVGSRPTPGGSAAFSGESRKKERRGPCALDPLLLWSARWHSLVLAWWDTLSRSPGPGRGIQAFSRESPDAKSRGGMPPAPPGLGPACCRSLVLALGSAAERSLGYFGAYVRALIWKLSFAKMLSSIFFLENASQIDFSIPEEIAPRTDQRQRSPKRANESERAINPGVQGAPPPALFLPISREKWGPPPGRRAPRGTAPRGCFRATHPKGTQHRAAPGRGAGFGPAQVQTCEVVPRPTPGGKPPRRG